MKSVRIFVTTICLLCFVCTANAAKLSELTGTQTLGDASAEWSIPGSITIGDNYPLVDSHNLRVLAGVIRGNADGTANSWSFIDDAEHTQTGFSAITAGTDKITVSFPSAVHVISFIAVPDEAYSGVGISVGSSVAVDHADIFLSRSQHVYGYIEGAASSNADAFSYSLSNGLTGAVYDQATGKITISHYDMGDGVSSLDVSITPTIYVGTRRMAVKPSSCTSTSSEMYILDSSGNIITGSSSTANKFMFSRKSKYSTINPRTLNISSSNIWIFAIVSND